MNVRVDVLRCAVYSLLRVPMGSDPNPTQVRVVPLENLTVIVPYIPPLPKGMVSYLALP